MTQSPPQTPDGVKAWWKRFVGAIRTVLQTQLQPLPTPESYFQTVREEALSLAEGEQMAEEVAKGYTSALQSPLFQPATIVGEELNAFANAVDGSKSGLKAKATAQQGLRKRL